MFKLIHPMRLFLLVIIAVGSIASLSACAGLSDLLAPSAQPLEQAAVAAAVMSTITANHADAATQKARAAKIASIANQVLALDTGTNMALVDIEIIVNSKIAALNLPPVDMLLADMLTASLGQALQAQLAITTKGAVSPQTQIAIAAVCKWVIVDSGA
jgi:hypothetical protein